MWTIETGGVHYSQGVFWFTPLNTQQGSHKAITDVEIITIRLGEMGAFEPIDDVKRHPKI